MPLDTLREVLVELGLDPEEVTAGARLRGDLDLDSTEIVQMELELRRRLGVEVKLESDRDHTVGEVAELVASVAAR
jgi:acyl carrier protein